MLFWTMVKAAFQSLVAHKLRSFLAMLGIIIGVGAVISMLALGAGARQQVMTRISAMGTNLLIVRPMQRGMHGVTSGIQQTLSLDDVRAVLDRVGGIGLAVPVVRGSCQVKYMNRNTRTSVIGSGVPYLAVRNFEIDRGRNFTELETERVARVAVIGSGTARDLFGEGEPLEQTIKINGINFRVIGILKSKGDQGYFNADDQVIIPYLTAMKQIFGLTYIHEIDIQAADAADLSRVQEDMAGVLRRRHRTQDGAPNDFDVRNQADIIEAASNVSQTFTLLLGGIASISLLVGGIGIMNIMLVTVTERTREIGIRKAIGAKDRDILSQFLVEAILMSGFGGMLGVAAGIGAAQAIPLIPAFSTFVTVIEIPNIILAISFAAGVGIFFGFYPAQRAAQLNPIDALRYE